MPTLLSPMTEMLPVFVSEPLSALSTAMPALLLPSTTIAPLLAMLPVKVPPGATRIAKRRSPCAKVPSSSPSLSLSAGV